MRSKFVPEKFRIGHAQAAPESWPRQCWDTILLRVPLERCHGCDSDFRYSGPWPPSLESAFVVDGLVKRYGDILAVDGISFSVARGSFTALLGGNGAGKTTTIAILLGLIRPTAGRITILDRDFAQHAKTLLARMNFQSPYRICRAA
jgi:ABC-type multidrug transport system fused ATPase/permease subunit